LVIETVKETLLVVYRNSLESCWREKLAKTVLNRVCQLAPGVYHPA
jgi:hypothetical protein